MRGEGWGLGWHLDHCVLAELGLSLGALAERGGPARVGSDLRGEEARELT